MHVCKIEQKKLKYVFHLRKLYLLHSPVSFRRLPRPYVKQPIDTCLTDILIVVLFKIYNNEKRKKAGTSFGRQKQQEQALNRCIVAWYRRGFATTKNGYGPAAMAIYLAGTVDRIGFIFRRTAKFPWAGLDNDDIGWRCFSYHQSLSSIEFET